ncbi:SMI1/KNR4 family protein [Paenibacillus sp. OV219]|uniref:SMI1/KNR4 family protein n=1 Tax=Paenibacillus sp. OV219 TaxID=1884377 RepID=UPI0008D6676F|nr:SMI1/KNR4 family protein [Paenibacillus sp. OV219]SEO53033.1 SMI1-KNR4 cell-wall [Paenibacillus sp. OV219]
MININNKVRADRSTIDQFQNQIRLRLPADYIAFLEQFNGGYPEPSIFHMKIYHPLDMESTIMKSFFGFGLENGDDLMEKYRFYKKLLPADSIPICSTEGGNIVLMSLSIENYGEIYIWDHERAHRHRAVLRDLQYITDSFTDFLKRIMPYDLSDVPTKGYEVESLWIHPDFYKIMNND